MSWHFLERWVEKANQHSTLIGKFWITFLIVCRMVIVATVGDRVYNDEQSEFKCNTLQPGCTNVCFNDFSPISHLRFWSFEILFVATPSVMFVIYSAHKTKTKKVTSKKIRSSTDDDEKAASERHQSPRRKLAAGASRNSREERRKQSNINQTDQVRFPTRSSKTSLSSANKHYLWRKTNAPWVDPTPLYPKSTLIRLKSSCDYVNNDMDQSCFDNNDVRNQAKCSPRESVTHFYVNRNQLPNNYYFADNLNNNNNSDRDQRLVWRKPTRKTDQSLGDNEEDEAPNVISWLPQQEGETQLRATDTDGLPEQTAQSEYYPERDLKKPSPNQGDFAETPTSPYAQFPTAPPRYPGFAENPYPSAKQDAEAWATMPREFNASPLIKQKKTKSSEKATKENAVEIRSAAAVLLAEHFRWYVANVFVRLCLEAGFAFLQLKLFGFHVPELFKCERWPCPNVVDCFISRPTEKTIFLWFMFIYSCICVALNVVEIIYLFYAYVAEKLAAGKQRRKRRRKQEKMTLQEKMNHKLGEDKLNGFSETQPNDRRYQMVMLDESLSSWSSRHHQGGKKLLQNRERIRSTGARLFHYDARNKDHGSQDFIAIMLDSEEEGNGEMNIARLEEDDMDINDIEEQDALNYDMDLNMGMENDEGEQASI